MKKMFGLCTLAITAALLFVAAPAKADDGPDISEIGAVKPIQESVIRLDRELVEFTVPSGSLAGAIPAKATFWFSNPTDGSVIVPSVFPLTFEGPGSWSGKDVVYAKNVNAKVDGQSVSGQVKYAEYPYANAENGKLTPKKAEGYAFTFTVPAKKTTKVEVIFDAPLNKVSYGGFSYYIGSGAGWAGPIREARFVVHYPHPLEKGWVEVGDTATGKSEIAGNDFTLTLKEIEPNSDFNSISIYFLPPDAAQRLLVARKGMESFKTADQWRGLADAYRSLEFSGGQFDAYRPQFAVEGYWMAIDEYLAAKKIDPFKPTDYDQAVELAEIYSDHWDSRIMGGQPDGPQFFDKAKLRRLFDYLNTQKAEWWGPDLHRLVGLLDLYAWRSGAKMQSEQKAQPTIASSTSEASQTNADQVSAEQIKLLKQDADALRAEVKNLRSPTEDKTRAIDPLVAWLLVLGGVLAGFATVALIKHYTSKR